eukprot:3807119-Rhodomonas_salina.1
MDVATSLNNIGIVYGALGENEQALAKFEESLRIKVKNVGHDHMEVAMSLGNIGKVYETQGENEQALAKYEQALAIF